MSHNGDTNTISLLKHFKPIGGITNTVNLSLNPVPGMPEIRLTPANFGPGNSLVDGPNPRRLSHVVSAQSEEVVDPTGTSAWIYVFGQFVDHDLDLEAVGVPTSASRSLLVTPTCPTPLSSQ